LFFRRFATDLVMILVATVWALNNVIMKGALTGWTTPAAFNTLRFGFGAILLALVCLLMEGSLKIPRNLFPHVLLLGLIGNGVNQMLFVNGLARSPAINAGAWLGIVPILVAFISGLFRIDKVTKWIWAGALISTSGILAILFVSEGGFHLGIGDLFFAGGVLAWAGYTVFSRPLAQQISPLRVTAVGMLTATAGLLVINLPALLKQDFGAITTHSWLGMAYAGGLSNALGYSLYVWAIRRAGPARVALYNNLGPVITALGAYWILGEAGSALQWLGILLVMAGVLIARWEDIRLMLGARLVDRSQKGA
jgi:drug/metabolite transporter (DMT)-like permease